jgi:hypothetical protein
MSWLALACFSSAGFSAAVLVDKFLLGCCIRNSSAYLLALVLFQQIFVIFGAAFLGLGFVYPYFLYALAVGAAQAALYAAYLRALTVEEASRGPSLIFVYPVFVFLGGGPASGRGAEPEALRRRADPCGKCSPRHQQANGRIYGLLPCSQAPLRILAIRSIIHYRN